MNVGSWKGNQKKSWKTFRKGRGRIHLSLSVPYLEQRNGIVNIGLVVPGEGVKATVFSRKDTRVYRSLLLF
jgi:hypothetical protein